MQQFRALHEVAVVLLTLFKFARTSFWYSWMQNVHKCEVFTSFNCLVFFAKFVKNYLLACKAQMGKIRYRPTGGVVTSYACFFPFIRESILQKILVNGAMHSQLN